MTQITEGFASTNTMEMPAAQKGRKSVFDQKRRMELMQKIQTFTVPINELRELLGALDKRIDKAAIKQLIDMYPAPHEQVFGCSTALVGIDCEVVGGAYGSPRVSCGACHN